MRKWTTLVTGLALGIATMAQAAEYQPGEVLVKFKDGVRRDHAQMQATYSMLGVKKVRRTGLPKNTEQWILKDTRGVTKTVGELIKNPAVAYAQPNYILRTQPLSKRLVAAQALPAGRVPNEDGDIPCIPGFDIPGCNPEAPVPCLIPGLFPPGCSDEPTDPDPTPTPDPTDPDPTPTPTPTNPGSGGPAVEPMPAEVIPAQEDPSLSSAYGLSKIGAVEAWKDWKGSKEIIVADIDTGIDYNHEDLSFNMWRNPNPTKGDLVGYDFVHNDGLPFDDNEHGTHTSGTIGAVGGNGKAISGVAQRVSLMGLKFLSGEGSGTTADAIRSIDYAVENGAKILSNSWGGPSDDENPLLEEAIVRAMKKDVLFIAAAGNGNMFGVGQNNDDPKNASYPAAFTTDNIISVAATDSNDKLASFSNYGVKTTHLAAPGVKVYSTTPGNKYAAHSGTSMACPHVAGAAALIWSRNPKMTYKEVKKVLMDSVDKLPGLEGKVTTGGRLNVLNALRLNELRSRE